MEFLGKGSFGSVYKLDENTASASSVLKCMVIIRYKKSLRYFKKSARIITQSTSNRSSTLLQNKI